MVEDHFVYPNEVKRGVLNRKVEQAFMYNLEVSNLGSKSDPSLRVFAIRIASSEFLQPCSKS